MDDLRTGRPAVREAVGRSVISGGRRESPARQGAPELNLKDLGERAWILYPQATPMRRLLELVFRDAGMPTPQNVVETSSVITTTTLLEVSDMLAVIPTSVANYYAQRNLLCLLPVPLTRRLEPYGIITRQGRFLSPVATEFLSALRAGGRPQRRGALIAVGGKRSAGRPGGQSGAPCARSSRRMNLARRCQLIHVRA